MIFEREISERDFNKVRINRTCPNDQELSQIIRKYKPNHNLTQKFPNDQDLGREFRKHKMEDRPFQDYIDTSPLHHYL